MWYETMIRPLLFNMDAERAHNLTLKSFKTLLGIPGVRSWLKNQYQVDSPKLVQSHWGLTFKNPIGLAAGLDKDGIIGRDWAYMGFGFVELGTVTPRPQMGNPKKRLFRLPQDDAIINRMGFNNLGVDALQQQLKQKDKPNIIVGANIGKNKDTPNEKAVEDYLICYRKLRDWVDYFVVNVSSPNTPGLRELQEKGPLTNLLLRLQDLNQKTTTPHPLLLKIAPDLTESQLDDILEVADKVQLSGIIATNTTISRTGLTTANSIVEEMGAGGLSGKPIADRSREVLKYLRMHAPNSLTIVNVGGIHNGKEALARMDLGADLLQVYTGFVYKGPELIREIVRLLD